MVRILAGGREMRLSVPDGGRRALEQRHTRDNVEKRQSGNESGSERERERQVCLEHAAGWSGAEAREWRAVESLIVGFKRRTPRVRRGASADLSLILPDINSPSLSPTTARCGHSHTARLPLTALAQVKLFHPLGEFCITCSDPPDVVLSFVQPHRSSRGEEECKLSRSNDPSRANRVERERHGAEARQQGKEVEEVREVKEVKVRATFSRIMGHLKIDTSMSWSGLGCDRGPGRGGTIPEPRDARGATETFRTRRVITLSQGNAAAAAAAAVADGASSGTNSRSTTFRSREPGSSSGGSDPLRHLDLRGSEAEREAVRRLVVLEEEWGRYA